MHQPICPGLRKYFGDGRRQFPIRDRAKFAGYPGLVLGNSISVRGGQAKICGRYADLVGTKKANLQIFSMVLQIFSMVH